MKYSRKLLCATLACSFIGFIFSKRIYSIVTNLSIGMKYQYYNNTSFSEDSEYAGYINFVISLLFLIFAYMFTREKKIKYDEKINKYLCILSTNTILYSIAINVNIFSRTTTYFDIYNCVCIPMIINNMQCVRNRRIFKLIILILMFAYWLIVAIYRNEWYGCILYQSYLK